jgi:CheY-like chemotaxis protein
VNLQIEKLVPPVAGKNYRIIVKDDGIGMSPELQQNLFVPFHQDERPEAGTTGVGLGLSIVKGILDLMGGSISVQSQVDKGSTITVNLPLKESQEPLKKRTALPRENALKGRSILVCEDDALNREIAKKILEAAGLQVDLAPDGGEGLRAFSSSDPGHYVAILMDLRMPHVDGFDATKLIRAGFHPDAKAIPIIALTGEVYEAETKAALEAGMNAVLAKPIDPQKLLSVLNEEVAKAASLH